MVFQWSPHCDRQIMAVELSSWFGYFVMCHDFSIHIHEKFCSIWHHLAICHRESLGSPILGVMGSQESVGGLRVVPVESPRVKRKSWSICHRLAINSVSKYGPKFEPPRVLRVGEGLGVESCTNRNVDLHTPILLLLTHRLACLLFTF